MQCFVKIVNDFKPLNIFAEKIHRKCLIDPDYVASLWINSHCVRICSSHWWKPSFKNVNYIVVVCLLLTRGSHQQRGSKKTIMPIKEFIISPSFIFTKNELLYRYFELLCLSCRTPILQSISRWLLLKTQVKNMKIFAFWVV